MTKVDAGMNRRQSDAQHNRLSVAQLIAHLRRGGTSYLILVVLLVGIAIPLSALLLGAFTDSRPGAISYNLSFETIFRVAGSASYRSAFILTIWLSMLVALLSTVGGGLLAWLVHKTDLPFRRMVAASAVIPLFLSPFVGAVAWRILGAPNSGLINVAAKEFLGFPRPLFRTDTLTGLIFVMTLYYVPYAYVFLSGSMRRIDPSLEEAAAISGAGSVRILRTVTLPILRPAIGAVFLLAAVMVAQMFSVPAILSSVSPLALQIQRDISRFPADFPAATAASLVLLLIAVAGLALYRRSVRNSQRFVTLTGKGFRPRRVRLRRSKPIWLIFALSYGIFAIVLPYLSLAYVALTRRAVVNLRDVSLDWSGFAKVITAPDVSSTILNTVVVAIAAALAGVLIAAGVAIATVRRPGTISRVLDYFASLPMAIPGLVLGLGMIWAFIRTPIYGTVWILAFAFAMAYLPHAVRLIASSLIQVDRSFEEASYMTGASRSYTARRITAPLIRSSLVAAVALIMLFSVREISASIVLYGPRSRVMSIAVWNFMEFGDLQAAAALGLLQTAALGLLAIVATAVTRRKGGVVL